MTAQSLLSRMLAPLGMRLWSQNLNEQGGGRMGSMWLAGRARLWVRQTDRGDDPSIGVEWRLGRLGLGARLIVEPRHGDDDCTLSATLPGVSLYLSTDRLFPAWVPRPRRDPHTIGFAVHDGGLWWDVWQNDVEWRSGTPRWRHGHFDPLDWLLGRRRFRRHLFGTQEAEVPMPEACYPATVSLEEHTWQRPRWPWPLRQYRAVINVAEGLPVPGKGENAWDCGEDAIYSLTTGATTVPQAVARLVRSCLETRARYGGPAWRPERARAR